VARDPDDDQVRVLAATKANLSTEAPSLRYRIKADGDISGIEWLGESAHSAETLLKSRDHEDRSACSEAKEFLHSVLADGPLAKKEISRQARELCISERTLRRAKEKLGIRSAKRGAPGEKTQQWLWELPDRGPEVGQPGHTLTFGHLREEPPPDMHVSSGLNPKVAKLPRREESGHLRDAQPEEGDDYELSI
jgi:hypothetical protein